MNGYDGTLIEPSGVINRETNHSFKLWPIHPDFQEALLEKGNVVVYALVLSLEKPLEWSVGFFFGNPELSCELWNAISGISDMDE